MYNKALKILQEHWGYSDFREAQKPIIKSVFEQQNTIALLPTGGGKSICYQIPALCFEGICIVISPLIALMQDQVKNLTNKGIKATLLPSGSTQDELITLFDNIRFGKTKFLYISPERLQSKFIQEKIKQLNVSLIAIDEAHCISEWGHDFRPSYRNINILKEHLLSTPIIAVTASATKKVIDDISESLQFTNPQIFRQSFYRENLAYQIFYTEDKLYKLQQIFKKNNTPSIVYVNSRNKTKDISNYLNANGFKSSFYHGGMSSVEKEIAFDNWMTEKTPIMVATNAFGMGIDKANVKVVVHLNLPSSIENYIQEAGRGGRNGKKAFSVVLTNKSDILLTQELLQKSLPTIKDIKVVHQKLYQQFQIALGDFIETPFEFNFLEFCNKYKFVPNKTYTALQILINNGIIQLENNYHKKSEVQFISSPKQVLYLTEKNHSAKNIVQLLLRMYGGIFEQPIKIDEFYLAKKLNTTSWFVIEELEKLAEKEMINYKKVNSNSDLFFLHPREDDKTINRISKNIEVYLKQKKEKTASLLKFVENDSVCRSKQLLHYFDETITNNCGICDVCLQNKTSINATSILNLLRKHNELSSKEICELLNENETNILILLRELLAEEKISCNSYNKYTIE
ncbi:DEAD/DEAH box helicase [Tenacibaculum holothuriorum]|uniref:ATP-dependent DNA helicase RecQ n=1 Tax=Tenacibaculum holothuriorum TaxID=1635173 RepID=A0A1Y2PHQ9_9FLAO|nr:ATP-dependent DNA helicase RecQ [Tenacibaculum holothuriorum]OSY89541.1 DEAD/DEAH box helicase [Tenacibaculum holothuriorum]